MPKKRFLVLVILVLYQTQQIKSREYSTMYQDDDIKNNQGTKQTIHTLKGHFNEEAHRLIRCGTNGEIKNETVHPTYDKSHIITETVNPNDTDIADIEKKILSQILNDFNYPASRSDTQPDISINKTDSKDYVLDKTQKKFEFESLLIKNQDAAMFRYDDGDDDDNKYETKHSKKNDTRRVLAYNAKVAQSPQNYFNPFENPPPRSIIVPPLGNPPPTSNNRPISLHTNTQNINPNSVSYNNPKPNPINNNEDFSQFHEDKVHEAHELTTSNNDKRNEHQNIKLTQKVENADVDFSDSNLITSEDTRSLTHDPTKGFGISEMNKSKLMLIQHPRVCFACSSTVNPSCWSPDRKTPTKYCRQGHGACLTKIYQKKGFSFVIRDCGDTCWNNGLAEYGLSYRSCTICNDDLCNGANSVKIYATNIIIMVFISLYFKINL